MLTSSLDDYGGPIADYAAVVDPTTEEAARFRNRSGWRKGGPNR